MLELIEAQNINAIMYYVFIRIAVILICWFFMICASLVDFWSGTDAAKACGEKLFSHGFRRTVKKIGDYARVMLFFLMFDILGCMLSFYILPFATMLGTIAVILIEGKSVIENSKRKKANAANIPDVINSIVNAATTDEGKKIFNQILQSATKNEKNK